MNRKESSQKSEIPMSQGEPLPEVMLAIMPDFPRWNRLFFRLDCGFAIANFFLACTFFAFFWGKNLIELPLDLYALLYLILPSVLNVIILVVAAVLRKRLPEMDMRQNMIPVFTMLLMNISVSMIHGIFFITLAIFCIPICMTTVYSTPKLCKAVTWISLCATLITVVRQFIGTTAQERLLVLLQGLIAVCILITVNKVSETAIRMTVGQKQKLIRFATDIKEEQQKAEAASEAKSLFLANMSHEIRTPINAILGMNEMVLRETRNEQIKEYAQSIHSAGNSLLYLVNDVLDLTKIESGKLELTENIYDLPSFIHDCYIMIAEKAEKKGLELTVTCDPQLPSQLKGDESRLRQVVTNLLSNAAKYTEKGSVALLFDRKEKDGQLLLVITVKDTGIGIKKENLDKLFTQFTRFDMEKNRNIEGTGLGLALAKRLTDLMQGTIEVESIYGVGTSVTLTVPQQMVESEPIGDFQQKYNSVIHKGETYHQSFEAPDVPLQERLFRLLTMVGLIGMALAVFMGVLTGENTTNNIGMGLGVVILFAITWFSIRFRKIQTGAVIMGGILVYLVAPYNFLSSGGLYGGGSSWYVLAMVFIALVVENKAKYILIASGLAVGWLCYYVAYLHPSVLGIHTTRMAYFDSLVSMMIVSVLTCGMILFQNYIYRSANRVARQQKQEIEELNQAQNRFFSSMSHEIRTPINTIIGLNEMILREAVSDEVAADARNIQAASKMLLALINDILDMSKMESGKMDIVPVSYDVGVMLSDIVNMIWVRAKEKGLEFHIDVDPTLPSQLLGDEVRVKQVLINVLNNAVKYTREGSVTLSIQYRKLENGSAQVIYSVTDTGMGIKKESLPYLFSAFRRVDEEKNRYIEGTGLGLSIVKQLVDLMNGDISVNSVYTKGTTFVITLPQEVVSEKEIGEIDFEARHMMNEKKYYKTSFEAPRARILIVDDNETNLMVEEKLLRDTKVQTETVDSGAECLKRTLQNQYDVILMDHLMPGMDGIECLNEIRTQKGGLNLETPVVILTANVSGEDQQLYKREGFDGYLAKPVTGGQLEAELIRHLPRELVTLMNWQDSLGVVERPFVERAKKKAFLLISTDSVTDLPEKLTDNEKIAVMPYRVVTQGGEFIDGQETETDGVLSYIRKGKRAHSEAPGIADYEAFFAEQLTKAQYVIHLTMAGKVSKGYENALEASKSFDNVEVIDTGHLSSGMGFMVLQAAAYAAEGMPPEAVIERIKRMRQRVRTSFIVDDTEYLLRAGRISPRINTICKAFMVHPMLELKNGKMVVGSIKIGAQKTAWKKYIDSALKNENSIDKKLLFLTHAGLSYGELQEIEAAVREKIAFEKIIYQKASPAISINCGMGAFGLLFMYKTRK